MARTRADRRYNTAKKTAARKAMAIRGEIDVFPAHGYCGGKIAINGEAASCARCKNALALERQFTEAWANRQITAFMDAIDS